MFAPTYPVALTRSQKLLKFSQRHGLLATLGTLASLLSILILLINLFRNRKWQTVITDSEYGAYLPWIVAQARHETNDYKSNLYVKYNSLFGMKVPSRRPFDGEIGPVAPDGGRYAMYKTKAQAAKDYLNLLRYNRFPINLANVETFVQRLKNDGYFTDTYNNYLNGLKRFL